jgi:segregation and condensation protein A
LQINKTRPRRRRTKAKAKEAAAAIAELAHQENLTEVAEKLDQLLNQSEFSSNQEWLELEQLLQIWCNVMQAEPEHSAVNHSNPERSHRVGYFGDYCYYPHNLRLELTQEEFYQEIKVRTLPNPSEAAIDAKA